jgi:hypothetical protein
MVLIAICVVMSVPDADRARLSGYMRGSALAKADGIRIQGNAAANIGGVARIKRRCKLSRHHLI